MKPPTLAYPPHLSEPLRREIAVLLMEKEVRKQFDTNVDVRTWMESLDVTTFWNAVEGFMGGALLKPIVHFMTAENYEWSKQTIEVESIRLSSPLLQLEKMIGFDTTDLSLGKIKNHLDAHPAQMSEQLALIESFDHNDEQDTYPVMVIEKESGPVVVDGNRRCLKALLTGVKTIDAWYCQTNNEPPRDFWYPIDDMMRLVKLYSVDTANVSTKQAVSQALTTIFAQSGVARIAYLNRIVGNGMRGAADLIQ